MAATRIPDLQPQRNDELREQILSLTPPEHTDPAIDHLVTEIIGRVADKWTMLTLEALTEHEELRFTRIADLLEGVSQKMLTKTLRQMERDGLLHRTVHPVVPPRVEYRLTTLGRSLGAAFCGVWMWAEKHHEEIAKARAQFDQIRPPGIPQPRVTG
jgi:DNA-binding HxlR family transcriptional regulator